VPSERAHIRNSQWDGVLSTRWIKLKKSSFQDK
jgi:hypothetical protein